MTFRLIMPRLTPKTAMWLWLIFGAIFAAFGISTFLSALDSTGLTRTVRFGAAVVGVAISAFYFRNAWNAYLFPGRPNFSANK